MDNVKPLKTSNLDPYMMDNMSFDAEKHAWRVSVIDGITLNAESINLPEIKFPEQQVIKVPEIIKEVEIHQVNVPVIVKETVIVEVPVIVKEFITIEVPVIVKEIEYIEKPIIIKETEFKELPTYIKVCMVVQAIASVGFLFIHLKG